MMPIVLASASPRRLQLMRMIGLEPRVIPPRVPEVPAAGEPPDAFIRRVALEKGRCVADGLPEDVLVVSADTAVILDDEMIGKPRSRDHARSILGRLSGRMHEVWTAVGLHYRGREVVDMERTRVWFAPLSGEEIENYLDREHYADKAGAYAIQGRAALFVERIDGCFFNVMGFPLRRFRVMTAREGVALGIGAQADPPNDGSAASR